MNFKKVHPDFGIEIKDIKINKADKKDINEIFKKNAFRMNFWFSPRGPRVHSQECAHCLKLEHGCLFNCHNKKLHVSRQFQNVKFFWLRCTLDFEVNCSI